MVNRSLTPTGVEHKPGDDNLPLCLGVNRSLTPTGVEHESYREYADQISREPIFDADRR